jgi:hypothetical protein
MGRIPKGKRTASQSQNHVAALDAGQCQARRREDTEMHRLVFCEGAGYIWFDGAYVRDLALVQFAGLPILAAVW